ncbi:hypothetical protein BC829DRAFT_409657 [Chytridium lagenaria]|nr:hypothetical protein BC829DRAFT_409657 [Chytridium lagenaria]
MLACSGSKLEEFFLGSSRVRTGGRFMMPETRAPPEMFLTATFESYCINSIGRLLSCLLSEIVSNCRQLRHLVLYDAGVTLNYWCRDTSKEFYAYILSAPQLETLSLPDFLLKQDAFATFTEAFATSPRQLPLKKLTLDINDDFDFLRNLPALLSLPNGPRSLCLNLPSKLENVIDDIREVESLFTWIATNPNCLRVLDVRICTSRMTSITSHRLLNAFLALAMVSTQLCTLKYSCGWLKDLRGMVDMIQERREASGMMPLCVSLQS